MSISYNVRGNKQIVILVQNLFGKICNLTLANYIDTVLPKIEEK